MSKKSAARLLAVIVSAVSLNVGFTGPSIAREGTSMGKGVKCYWALVSSVNGVNTYQQVCRKGI